MPAVYVAGPSQRSYGGYFWPQTELSPGPHRIADRLGQKEKKGCFSYWKETKLDSEGFGEKKKTREKAEKCLNKMKREFLRLFHLCFLLGYLN